MSDVLDDLPLEVRRVITPYVEAAPGVLDAIGVQIAQKRDDAKQWRKSSGIETTWSECEEAYLGIDEVNRHEWTDAKWAKPMSMDGPVTTTRRSHEGDYRSTVYHRLTTRYVDAGVAKLTEILLPADDKAFSFSETPAPELIQAKDDGSQVRHGGLDQPLFRDAGPGDMPPGAPPQVAALPTPSAPAAPAGAAPPPSGAPLPDAGAPPAPGALPPPGLPGVPPAVPGGGPAPPDLTGAAAPPAPAAGPPQVPLTVKDLAMEKIEMARKKAKAAETRIADWLVETGYRAEIRKVIGDAARIGVGVLKGPIAKSKRVMAVVQTEDGGVDLQIKDKVIPAAQWVDPWDIFPDPACGENIHDGDYIFERDHMSARQVRNLKKLPDYIESQIDKVLEEGPDKSYLESERSTEGIKSKGRFEVWYFYGTLTKEEVRAIDQAAGRTPSDEDDIKPGTSYVIVTLINDSVVKAVINPLDSGSFPYHSMPWQRRARHWAGVGVAEQMRAPQRIVNAALRALLNNAGKSAGCQLVVDLAAIRPADGQWAITPDKIWYKTQDGPADVRQAMMPIEVPNVTNQLTEIITMAERFAEETTSIPLIAQGQSGATTPDTFGAAQLQNNNANQLLRSIGYAFDDYITEPFITQMYEWLLLDPDVPNSEKGEFQIDAHGSVALVERAIQDQSIAQMGQLVANQIYGTDPKKWVRLFIRSKHLNPDDIMYSEEELQKLASQPPPEAPQVTVAKINSDTQLKLGVMKQQVDQQTAQAEAQIAAAAHVLETGRVQVEQQKTHLEATIAAHQADMEHQRAQEEAASRQQISLDQAKAGLAKTAMQIATEKELNAANHAIELHKHHNPPPPVQVPGRAANGHAYDQSPAP
jgi:hypothetical protein